MSHRKSYCCCALDEIETTVHLQCYTRVLFQSGPWPACRELNSSRSEASRQLHDYDVSSYPHDEGRADGGVKQACTVNLASDA